MKCMNIWGIDCEEGGCWRGEEEWEYDRKLLDEDRWDYWRNGSGKWKGYRSWEGELWRIVDLWRDGRKDEKDGWDWYWIWSEEGCEWICGGGWRDEEGNEY